MIVALGFLVAAKLILLAVVALHYRRCWKMERAWRLEIHRARIADNNQRSVDNERWAERVAQGKRYAFERGFKWGQHTGVKMETALSIEGFDK